MLITETKSKLLDLGLKGMSSELESQIQRKLIKVSFEERFGYLVDAEINDRENRRIERLKKSAKLRQSGASLENIDFSPERKLDKNQIMSLAECQWIAKNQNILITGRTGTGKTYMASGIGNEACSRNHSVYFITATQLFEDLYRAFLENTLPKIRRMLVKFDVLILDDLGISTINPTVAPILLDIIDMQSQRGALIITSQYPVSKWYDIFSDTTIADAVLDRVVTQSHSIKMQGDSQRKTRVK
jgi:DNA replication protein DnaC